MPITTRLTALIQAHKTLPHFNYSLAVEWAMQLIEKGIETQNVLMLASFNSPIDRFEIKSYVSKVLNEVKLADTAGDEAFLAIIGYYTTEIVFNRNVRANLRELFNLYNYSDNDFGLFPFYLLYHGWYELEETGYNDYYDATLDTIELKLKEEAYNWLENN